MIEAAEICDVVAKRNENHPVNWAHNCAAFIRIAANELDAAAAMQAKIDKAVEEERERCATVARMAMVDNNEADELTCSIIAAAIRKGAKP